jgi:hypothetical protein
MKKLILVSGISVLLGACTAHSKTILIFASSNIQVDNTQKNITLGEGTTHHEKDLEFSGADPVTINVQSPSGKFTLNAEGDGLYIANLKPDTVVGSYQHIGAEGDSKITQEQLKLKLDSLRQLVAGQNISESNRNFFIPPGKIVKVSSDTHSKVFGPYTTIPSAFDAGSVPEVYKFYTAREVREIIDKLSGMTKYENQPQEAK